MTFDITEISDQQLRGMEVGWREVTAGLGKVLVGYFMYAAAAGLLVASALTKNSNIFFAAFGLYFITTLVSAYTIVVGKWRCLYAPERYGSKWFVFSSMLCYVLMLLLVVLFRRRWDPNALAVLQPAFVILNCLAWVLFVLFLITVGLCWENSTLVGLAVCYLLFIGLLFAGSAYLVATTDIARQEAGKIARHVADDFNSPTDSLTTALAIGWMVQFVFYLFLILLGRSVINHGIRTSRSPLGKQFI